MSDTIKSIVGWAVIVWLPARVVALAAGVAFPPIADWCLLGVGAVFGAVVTWRARS